MRDSRRYAGYAEFVAARQAHFGRIAHAICGDPVQAQDLLQTALVKLYLAWPRVHRGGQEEAYFRQILVRSNIDEHRRPWRRREQQGLDERPEPVEASGLPYEDRTALWDSLRALPSMQRKVVVMRHWLGLSVRETAEELGIAEGTVKSYSARGLAALQEALSNSNP